MPSRRHGYTLVELVIVLGVIVVLATVGIASTSKHMPRFRTVGVAKELKQDLMQLRNTAAERGVETRLVLVDSDASYSDWTSDNVGSWKLQVGDRSLNSVTWTDLGSSGQAFVEVSRHGQDEVKGVSLAPWDTLVGPGSGNSDAIVFSPRGMVTNPDGDFGTDGYVTVTVVNKDSWKHGIADHVELKIARSGNVTMVTTLGSDDAGTVGTSDATNGVGGS